MDVIRAKASWAVRASHMSWVSKILIGCHGGGAGHATRSIAIARRIREASPKTEIFFTCSGAGVKFIRMNGFRCLETPQPAARMLDRAMGVDYSYKRIPFDAMAYFRKTFRLIRSFRPDIVVSDMDFAATVISKMLGIPNFLISHLVERFFYPEVGILNYPKMVGLRVLYRCSYRIFVPDVLGLPIPEGLTDKSIRIGYLACISKRSREPRNTAEQRILFVPSDMNRAMGDQILTELCKVPRARVLSRHRPSVDLENVEFVDPVPELSEHIAESDLIVCSGYTTVMEAVAANRPCVLVPGNFEQSFIGSLGEAKGVLSVAKIQDLRLKVQRLLNDPETRDRMATSQLSVNDGTQEVVRHVLSMGSEPQKELM